MSIRCVSHPLRGQPRVGWRPAKRHPALPTACPGACKALQGVRVPQRRSEYACGEAEGENTWGWRSAPFLDSSSQELGEVTSASKHCISSQGFSDSRQWSSYFRLHSPALNGLSTQWSFLSRRCKLRHQIIDILQMYLLQFISWGFFSNSVQEFRIIVSWLEVDWLYSTLASLCCTMLNLLCIFCLRHNFTIVIFHKFNERILGIKSIRPRILFFLAVCSPMTWEVFFARL